MLISVVYVSIHPGIVFFLIKPHMANDTVTLMLGYDILLKLDARSHIVLPALTD